MVMTLKQRVESFSELGMILRDALEGITNSYSTDIEKHINNQQLKNPWFTPDNVKLAIKSIADELTYENLLEWTNCYPSLNDDNKSINVGVIMAGNIPLAGFHDFLSVLITGNNIIAKTSSKDQDLIVLIGRILSEINPEFKNKIIFNEGTLKDFDAVIATGSDNSSRYFEYYFRKYYHIIRRNRNSIAVIRGTESEKELTSLGKDVFSYFGFGCRNVSKIYFPEGYRISELTKYWVGYSSIINHNKYANNYDYNKAIFQVNREEFIDTGYLIFRENKSIASPVAVLFYEFYNSVNDVYKTIEKERDRIQCVISKNDTPFGNAQSPHLWDYADGIDTVDFLLKKK